MHYESFEQTWDAYNTLVRDEEALRSERSSSRLNALLTTLALVSAVGSVGPIGDALARVGDGAATAGDWTVLGLAAAAVTALATQVPSLLRDR
jgi:hypothetical protein